MRGLMGDINFWAIILVSWGEKGWGQTLQRRERVEGGDTEKKKAPFYFFFALSQFGG